ncbi:MAG: hypothetical protein IJV40_07305 [Oscillospiraceae bacterium]|nr:hypothetical protein [Oscillospiraceae bacterium]
MTSADSYELSAELNGISRLLCVLRDSLDAEDKPTKETLQYACDGLIKHLDRIVNELDA